MKSAVLLIVLAAMAGTVGAKLPAPSDEAKAKAAENAAKAAHGGKVEAYLLCQSQDKVAARYLAETKKAGTAVQPVAATPCVNPGPFVYAPPEAAGAAAPAAAPATTAAAAPPAKK